MSMCLCVCTHVHFIVQNSICAYAEISREQNSNMLIIEYKKEKRRKKKEERKCSQFPSQYVLHKIIQMTTQFPHKLQTTPGEISVFSVYLKIKNWNLEKKIIICTTFSVYAVGAPNFIYVINLWGAVTLVQLPIHMFKPPI